MDYLHDQDTQDNFDDEFEVVDIDIDIDAAENVSVPPVVLSSRSHRNGQNWQRFSPRMQLGLLLMTLLTGVIILLLLFPDVETVIKLTAFPTPSPVVTSVPVPASFISAPANNNVTVVADTQIDNGQDQKLASLTAYDTASGVLLWHTSPSPTMTYNIIQDGQSHLCDLYARRSDGLISLLAPRSGQVLWQYKLPSTISSAFAQDGVFFFQGADTTLYAVQNGRLLWQDPSVGGVTQITNGIVYSYNDKQQSYHAVNERTGYQFWSYADMMRYSSPILSNAIIENNILYMQTQDYKLQALSLNGHVLWTHQFDSVVIFTGDAHALYVVDSLTNVVDSLNLRSGAIEKAYHNDPGASRIMGIQDGLLYIGDSEGLTVINMVSGKLAWQYKTDAVDQPMEEIDGVVYIVPSGGGTVQARAGNDGAVLWSKKMDGHSAGSGPTVLYFVSADNSTLSVLRLSDGKLLWAKHVE